MEGKWGCFLRGAGRTFAPCNTDAVDVDLETQAALLLEDASGKPGPHAGWCDLACGIEGGSSDAIRELDRARHGRQCDIHVLIRVVCIIGTRGCAVVHV